MDNANGDRKHQNPTILPPDHVSSPSHPTRKQKRLGPAPIASIEDTTHEDKHRMEATGQSHKSRWYSAKECESPKRQSPPSAVGSTSALAPSTPRIDISRASSHSSHHDSRDSSPENVFDQDSGVLGYREEGTMDLRSSTEELQFMEPEKGRTEREKPQAPRYSPVMFKFDEPQSISLHHQRKDSASSEVAAFLCISGRTSRISSVGSQGSANSKLSAVSGVSGISRSPSPHRMLLETSFCGPKPLHGITDGSIPSSIEPSTAKMLEQVILSRKKDPTEAVIAEGVNMDTTFTAVKSNNVPETELIRRKSDSNANITRKEELIQPPQTSRSISNKRYIPPTDLNKPIVGVMPSGTEYIRIKLKPDHCYSDNGIADNERIMEDDQKKPRSLNLESSRDKREGSSRAGTSVSPKPTRHAKLSRENGSRSPSPANTTFSRKSSFCSIFKLKDSASPDSPGGSHMRKKSGSNISHEFRERSRSKSRERDTASLNTTPSKQKSVLAIFKPKKNGTKSKSPSPIDANPHGTLSNVANVEFKFKHESPSTANPRPNLRYYDTPLDGKSIHIPLHTPPEEKQMKPLLSTNPAPPLKPEPEIVPDKVSPSTQSVKLSNNCIVTIHNRPKPMPPLKCYRIENPDGTITIPLRSPTEEKERDSLWSMEVQRNSSQDSQDTVISAAAHQPSNTLPTNTANALPSANQSNQNGVVPSPKSNENEAVVPVVTEVNIEHQEMKQAAAIANMTAKERKQLLFSMKVGSGSQEQTFTTQFSISKTESQCSQLSEAVQAGSVNGEAAGKTELSASETPPVVYRNKQIDSVKRRSPKERFSRSDSTSGDSIDFHRHSRYIENPEEILNMQQKSEMARRKNELNPTVSEESSVSQDTSRDDSTVKMSSKTKSALNVPDRKSTASNDEQGVSSESEKDSEVDSTTTSKHMHPNMLAIEDHESAGLVLQESFDDELPYIPTTLPEERSVGVKLVPMKERAQMEMKTCPLERPRSTTPIHPASLENYCGITQITDDTDGHLVRGEKLRISLPKKHDIAMDKAPKSRSPRKASISSGKNWFEFAEQGISSTSQAQTSNNGEERTFTSQSSNVEEEPPPLPPRKGSTQQWIDFESIPEKRKPPKRITTLPQAESVDDKAPMAGVVYNYVKPEECQCECHESEREGGKQTQQSMHDHEIEDEQPLLQQDLSDESNMSGRDEHLQRGSFDRHHMNEANTSQKQL
ncbi:uncharacterized protein LOC109406739 isoform X2 [Aedes albopictus]|uniref:Uncharacterized protein n=1 Tax=Aedes albopictus TaxID=7160 RepID=A0ABM1YHE2_AEDAL